MSKKLFVLISCIIAPLLFTSCSRQYNTSNTYIPYQDDQYTYKTQGNFSEMAESEDGYYFFCGFYLYYVDKAAMKPVILCNKPNCLHYDETDPAKITSCNAFFPGLGSGNSVSYFDGNVYVLKKDLTDKTNTAYELIRLSTDGTKRKTVLHFQYQPSSLAIHRGKVYIASQVFDKSGASVYGVSQYDLSKSSSQKPVTIYRGKLPGGAIQDIICYGQNVYFTEYAMNSEITATRIQHYDLNTKKAACIIQEKDNSYPGALAFFKEHILYSYSTIDPAGKILQAENYISALDGSRAEKSFSTVPYQNRFSDGKYIYIDDVKWSPFSKATDELSLTVTDSEGNAIASAPTGAYSKTSSIICGSDKHLFLKNQTDSTYQIFYADKEEFKTGAVNFGLLFEIEYDKMMPRFTTKD